MLSVLIVDDSAMLRELFAEYLACAGFEIAGVVGNVPDAVELAVAKRPDVALLDYHLGRQLGTELMSSTRVTCKRAILYLSGNPLDGSLTNADGEGFIQKPVSLADLAAALMAVWKLKASGSRQDIDAPFGLRWLPDGRTS